MAEVLVGLLAFVAFVCLVLPTEWWFDLLPRRLARRIGRCLWSS